MKNIAIIGLSPDKNKASHIVGKYLQEKSYKIYPVYPKEEIILEEKVYRNLKDIPFIVDTVVMFRKANFAEEIFSDLVEKNIRNFWMQLGIINEKIYQECQKFHIACVQNKCIKIELEQRKINDRIK
ncbi:CoA-binding protein [Campylobacter insulaenigrae]|uniref:CoA-binding protein n=1 Tax=Campylobacter insulaenigrae TaxID=260714 RepID=A0ABY3G3K8_9BACT|nr:CoA-binding protein [Campylobacter insulaenigrae]MCR6570318.1 CoA-binding protein [Campylobacter insulaenigrae]MCR6571720.1 CoA-binding protein [Campylobacter insulaenigrae]MCR6573357.1 CoA-binding protein [Campylobacter insulaenigrae]MCR6574822.1 CoA-binding protein [Campylobacter insulaenigrae]MCR6576486.1 CoA-binding protein [Campylobacter insulaenigrae]